MKREEKEKAKYFDQGKGDKAIKLEAAVFAKSLEKAKTAYDAAEWQRDALVKEAKEPLHWFEEFQKAGWDKAVVDYGDALKKLVQASRDTLKYMGR